MSFDFAPWTPPFRYDDFGTQIVDSKNRKIVDIRGWGFLTGRGHEALKLSDEEGAAIQDKLGKFLAAMMSVLANGARLAPSNEHSNMKSKKNQPRGRVRTNDT